ncbi:NAD(P)H-dependent oxidoreductase [Brachyspira sp.]|uniref:NAD(P)H-dependent oxidoreductase n=1 Tax=Brachyspira sp. TaxID=1977261 RepID=UPI00263803F2|nr:NAD(P)H-dependent oxidoreductase [Brachyspira sp.]
MNILVINGSPKGNNSVTLQTLLFLEKLFIEHKFSFLNVGQKLRYYEKNFNEVEKAFEKSDIIIFSYPVYTFLVPYQLHRFIELLKENNINVKNKFATQFSTSKHFYDTTAHKFLEENCLDLNFKYIKGLSADMDDLMKKEGQNDAINFFNYLIFSAENNIYLYKEIINHKEKKLHQRKYTYSLENKDSSKDVLILSNTSEDDENLRNIIEDFKSIFPYKTREINIREYNFHGGCLGCFGCALTGKCVYKDKFDDFLRNEIQTADAIIYAFTIENHYTHSSFKIYEDRQFCNGHRTVTEGMPIGYIVSGDYEAEANLQTLIEARSEVGGNFLTHVANDNNKDILEELSKLSSVMKYAIENKCTRPKNFYGVGGMKIFRDLIYIMQGIMKEDHRYYKKHNIYDFPQKQKMKMLQMKLVGALISIPSMQKKMKGKMNEYILMPYKKVIDNVKIKRS